MTHILDVLLSYGFYVWAAYAFSGIALGALICLSAYQYRNAKRRLHVLDQTAHSS